MMVLVVVGLLSAMLIESASARTPRVRRDPDDSTGGLDIRMVLTRTSPRRLVLWIGMWDRLHASEGFDFIVIPMDTRSTKPMDRSADRGVTIFPERHRCTVDEYKTGRYIGHRPSRRRGERSIGCNLPLGWFDINKAVRFRVWGVNYGDADRAPTNRERDYVGL
jgi:hypothetical protein